LNWNKWIRQTHRWLSMAFTVAVIANIVAVAQKKYTTGVGLLAVFPSKPPQPKFSLALS
jgi:hypothetical protein